MKNNLPKLIASLSMVNLTKLNNPVLKILKKALKIMVSEVSNINILFLEMKIAILLRSKINLKQCLLCVRDKNMMMEQ